MTNKQVAETILQQIKAIDYWALGAWGAKQYIAIENGVTFKVNGTKTKMGSVAEIKLNGKDLYDIRITRVITSRGVRKVVVDNEANDVYCDMLVEILDEFIG